MSCKNSVYLLHITIPVLIAVISFFIISDLTSSPEYSGEMAASLDESREDVLKLAASSTAVSVAITALPGDLATPVADNLADLSKGFLVVLCGLYLEKFLVSVTGIVAFRWLVPIACGIYIIGFVIKNNSFKRLSYKLFCFALAVFLVIPAEIGISGFIQENYGQMIEQTVTSAESCAGLMEESVGETEIDEDTGRGLGKVLENLQQSGDKLARGTSQFIRYLEKLVNQFTEVIAIMIVTSCVIPILVILGFVWISKMIFLADFGDKGKCMDSSRGIEKLGEGATDEKSGG